MTYKFSKPYEFEGKTYEELTIDLESLKGSDIATVTRQWNQAGNFAALPKIDCDFCARLAARVAKQPLEFFNEMPGRDYSNITQEVSNFLMS